MKQISESSALHHRLPDLVGQQQIESAPTGQMQFMACNIPVVAAKVGSLKEILKDHPEWLYEPGNPASLVETLEKRLVENKTDYDISPVWMDLAMEVEKIMLNLVKEPF